MKAKIYPLSVSKNLKMEVPASQKLLHFEIICAALAKGKSTIKNVNYSKNILDTIDWCSKIGATIKKEKNKLVITGVNNKVDISSTIFETDNSSSTFLYMLPLLSLANKPIILKSKNQKIISRATPFKHIFEKENLFYYEDKNTVKIEKALKSSFVYINGFNNTKAILGLLITLPLLSSTSKIIIKAPITSYEDIVYAIKILKKFGVTINLNATNHTIEIPANQTFKATSIKTKPDYFLASLFSILYFHPTANVSLTNVKKNDDGADFMFFNNLKEYNLDLNKSSMYKKRKELELTKVNLKLHINALSLYMALSLFSKKSVTIKSIDLNNPAIKNQFNIMLDVFKTLEVQSIIEENQITIFNKKLEHKKQVDCKNNPYIAIILSLFGLISNAPIIVKNCQCVESIYHGFYDKLKEFGAIVEFIHD